MRKPWFIIGIIYALTAGTICLYAFNSKSSSSHPYLLKDGDIVFQEGFHTQGKAIKAATGSRWTHVGIVFHKDAEPFVIEAVQPVKVTKLKDFIKRNPASFYAMRLKDSERSLTAEATAKALTYCRKQLGKDYDARFQWSDDRIYCSELVWKAYKEALGIELCKTRTFRSYNLKHPTVEKIITQRYGSVNALPLDELIVAPSDIADSELLIEVPKIKVID